MSDYKKLNFTGRLRDLKNFDSTTDFKRLIEPLSKGQLQREVALNYYKNVYATWHGENCGGHENER